MVIAYLLVTCLFVIFDLRSLGVVSAGAFIGGCFLLQAPILIVSGGGYIEKIASLRNRVGRILAALFVALPPMVYAVIPHVQEGSASGVGIASGFLLLSAIFAAIGWFVQSKLAALNESGGDGVVSSILISIMAVLGFFAVHHDEGTFYSVREDGATLHYIFFVASWGLTQFVAWSGWFFSAPENLRDPIRTERQWINWLIGALCFVVGAALVYADRVFFLNLYAGIHIWLGFIGVILTGWGLWALVERIMPRPINKKIYLIATIISLIWSGCFVGLNTKLDVVQRTQLADTALGRSLLTTFASRKGASSNKKHPLLTYEKYLREKGPDEKYNIIVITVDALRNDQLDNKMPSIREYMQDAIRFRRTYSQGTRTAIAVGSLMLGQFAANVEWKMRMYAGGVLYDPTNLSPQDKAKLGDKYVYTTVPGNAKNKYLATRMKKAGYFTMASPYAGKNEFFVKGSPFMNGFDDVSYLAKKKLTVPTSGAIKDTALEQIDKWSQKQSDKPFFQWLHFYDPHESKGNKTKYQELSGDFDAAFGDLIAGLKERGLYDNTVVILTADHGEALGEHGQKGHASSVYEEQCRVPLVIRIPGTKAAVNDTPVALIDVTATVLSLASADREDLDGVNLLPLINDGRYPAKRPIFVELFRYHSNKPKLTSDLRAVLLGNVKLQRDRLNGAEKLFLLDKDPNENKNVYMQQQQLAKELSEALSSFLSKAEASHPLP